MVTTRSKASGGGSPIARIGVAVVGSSGGGAATLGHTDPVRLLQQIQLELGRCHASAAPGSTAENKREVHVGEFPPIPYIRYALYVSLHSGKGLDHVTDTDLATLYAVGCGEEEEDDSNASSSNNDSTCTSGGRLRIRSVITGPLSEVNEVARCLDQRHIAASILDSSTRGGLICISADPKNVSTCSISAASKMGIPLTGSGGTSLAYMSAKLGVQLVGNAGGSVATTTYTRAVSYVCALVDAWNHNNTTYTSGGWRWTYSPFVPSRYGNAEEEAKPSLRSVLDSCVPAFVAVCVTRRLLELAMTWLTDHDFDLKHYSVSLLNIESLYLPMREYVLPMVCAVVAATTYAPELGPIVLMASSIASISCGGSALAGLMAGRAVAYLCQRTLFGCIRRNVPATMTNVLVAGGVGCFVAVLLGLCGFVHLLAWLGDALRSVVRLSFLTTPQRGLGFAIGVIFCYGSKVGWYHSIFLPLILIEMEQGDASILGAVDECTLCLVSAGICFGNIVTSMLLAENDVAISKRGVKINLLCGDFIEAAYPFMERSVIVNGFAYLAGGLSTEILYSQRPEDVLSSAYLPFGLCIVLANDVERMTLACGVAFVISFLGTVIGNIVSWRKTPNEVEDTDSNILSKKEK